METVFKYIKLPFSFDAGSLLKEVYNLADIWLPHYNSQDYTGEWKAIPLRSVNGSLTHVVALQVGVAAYNDTVLMKQCPAIKTILDSFLCEKTAVRLLNLRAGAVVKEHVDPGLNYEEGEIRLHIPLSTNDNVEFYIEDERMKLMPGECWYMNFNLRHKLSNIGTTDRIHLVIDCIVNNWVDELFSNCKEVNIKRNPVEEQFSNDDKYMIIQQLKNLGTETALSLAKNMEEELSIQSSIWKQ